MEAATVISQMIGSVGFPIAACVVLFYQNNKLQETLATLSTTLVSLTSKIEEMNSRIETIEDEVKK